LNTIQFIVERTSTVDLNSSFDISWFAPFCA
jgi:hypothetical protein